MKAFTKYILLTALFMAGCQKEVVTLNPSEGSAIYLSAITEGHDETRTPYNQTTPTENSEGVLHAAIWASSFESNNTYTYPHIDINGTGLNGQNGTGEYANKVAIHVTAAFDSGNPQLLNEAVYPKSGNTVYFVGFHPQDGWSANTDSTSAEFVFDGSHDVMFAPRIEGRYASDSTLDPNNPVFETPTLTFYHLLTWLKVRIAAENEDAVTAWGKIKSLKIKSHNKVCIDISHSDSHLFDPERVTYSSTGNQGQEIWLPLYATNTDNQFPSADGYSLQTGDYKDVAYVLCAPVKGKDFTTVDGVDVEVAEYTLLIETSNRKIEVPIDLRKNANADGYFTDSTRAKSFTLNLTFKVGTTILVSAEVDKWEFGGMGEIIL